MPFLSVELVYAGVRLCRFAEGRYSSLSEYVRELIREDEKRKAQERREALLLEGLESEASLLTREDLNDIRSETLTLLKTRKKRR